MTEVIVDTVVPVPVESERAATVDVDVDATMPGSVDVSVDAPTIVGSDIPVLPDLVTINNGTEGKPGLSAYEVAVAEGFEGSESEWLDSLHGAQGPAGEGRNLELIPAQHWFRIETDMLADEGDTAKLQVIIRGVHGHVTGAENGAFGQWTTVFAVIQVNKAPDAGYTHLSCLSFGGIAHARVATVNGHITVYVQRDSLYESHFAADMVAIKGDVQGKILEQLTVTTISADAQIIPIDVVNRETLAPMKMITNAMSGSQVRDWATETQPDADYRVTVGSAGYWYGDNAGGTTRNYDVNFSHVDRRAYSGFFISNKNRFFNHYFLWVDEEGQVFTRHRYQTGDEWTRFWSEANLTAEALAELLLSAPAEQREAVQEALEIEHFTGTLTADGDIIVSPDSGNTVVDGVLNVVASGTTNVTSMIISNVGAGSTGFEIHGPSAGRFALGHYSGGVTNVHATNRGGLVIGVRGSGGISSSRAAIRLESDLKAEDAAQAVVEITRSTTDKPYLLFKAGPDTVESKINSDGEYEAPGMVLTSPNGTRYRVTVDDAGNLSTTRLLL